MEQPAPRPAPRSLCYPFVPFPVELAELERRHSLPPAQLRILALRRFAHPVTGDWMTTTQEVAQLIGTDRSTAQKALRALEAAHFLHLVHLRGRTVQLVISFGGFAEPTYRTAGKPALHWDADGTPAVTVGAHSPSQSSPSWHSAERTQNVSGKPLSAAGAYPFGTVPRLENERNIVRSNEEQISPDLSPPHPGLLPVATFVPSMHDEAVVQELARKMGEKYMNSFLSLRRVYGLARLERACGWAVDKRLNPHHPLRSRPGAYVRWLLQSGQC
jgi:hypothetical protein